MGVHTPLLIIAIITEVLFRILQKEKTYDNLFEAQIRLHIHYFRKYL